MTATGDELYLSEERLSVLSAYGYENADKQKVSLAAGVFRDNDNNDRVFNGPPHIRRRTAGG